jgi:hypothetical protein
MAEVYDLSDISEHVRAAIKRSGIKRKPIAARMKRFTRVAAMARASMSRQDHRSVSPKSTAGIWCVKLESR